MLSIKKYTGLFIMVALWIPLMSQVTHEQEVIEQAMTNYPSMQRANLEIQKQKALERTSFNPQQPQFVIETPSDMGIAFEIEQQFDFPGVYSRQSKLLKSKTRLVTESANITRQQLKKEIRLAYLDAQIAQAKVLYLIRQDSLWKEITAKTLTLFDSGQINRADLLFAENQSGKINYFLITAQTKAANTLSTLSG
ncbi:MAG: TolC family protein, partial [Saprospiraceae bacterium]